MTAADASDLYDARYFKTGCGPIPYERRQEWLDLNATFADRIVSGIAPGSALDAGCAMGFLVEALRDRGVEAYGIDISEYAIGQVREDIRPYCRVGSLTDPLPRRYDLIVCIEVLEHLTPNEGERVIANLCAASDDLLISSTPDDYTEATHFNVQPPDYWAAAFARHGYLRDVDFDASFITPWAIRFRKSQEPLPRVVAPYERKLWALTRQVVALRSLSLGSRTRLAELEEQIATQVAERDRVIQDLTSEAADKDRELDSLRHQVADAEQALQALTSRAADRDQLARDKQRLERELDLVAHERDEVRLRLNNIEKRLSWQLLSNAWELQFRLAPPTSPQGRAWMSLTRAARKTLFSKSRAAQRPSETHDLRGASAKSSASGGERIPLTTPADRHASRAVPPHTATVDIIVCVHNAAADVKRCLESVIRCTSPPYTLILVDDGSDEETRSYLADFARYQGATLLRNDQATGYTFAANRGLRRSSADYVVLLNSDTIVTAGWLDRMVACGESDPRVGAIGPLSNAASWQSIPQIFGPDGDWTTNDIPEGMSIDELGRLVADYSARTYPRIAFLNGFCLLIKRKALEEIGYFDEASFGQGYGEENDYCMRARQRGWLLAVADDTYVYHHQSRSYSHERRLELRERADRALLAKYDRRDIVAGVSVCQHDRVLEGVRARNQALLVREQLIADGLARWEGCRLSFVLPVLEPSGGAYVVIQEARAMQRMGVDVRIVNLRAHRDVFERSYPDNTLPIVYVERESDVADACRECDAVVATLYRSVDWLAPLRSAMKAPALGYYIQDYEPEFFARDSAEYREALASYVRYPELIRLTKTEWNRCRVHEATGADSSLVGPSVDLDAFQPRRRRDLSWPDRPLRVAAMIRPSTPRRQPRETMEALRDLQRRHGDTIQVFLFGCDADDPEFRKLPLDFDWENLGVLTRPQLAALFNEVDVFADLSAFQAMGLTAMEAMACGVATVVPQTGGSAAFARHEENSLIVNTRSRSDCRAALERLALDEPLRTRLQRQGVRDICRFPPEQAARNALDALLGNDRAGWGRPC